MMTTTIMMTMTIKMTTKTTMMTTIMIMTIKITMKTTMITKMMMAVQMRKVILRTARQTTLHRVYKLFSLNLRVSKLSCFRFLKQFKR